LTVAYLKPLAENKADSSTMTAESSNEEQ